MTDAQDLGARPQRRRTFGRPQNRHDYEQSGYAMKYDNDGFGEEVGENARVWRMFLDEGSAHDTRAFQGLRDHLDVDLVFSGLFAAVVTTCVAQSSQALQPDHAEISASLLAEMIAVQRAIASGVEVSEIPPSALQPGDATASSLDFWTNRFWYLSLLLGLFAAFLAFIVRGWLYAYDNEVYGSPKHRALTRHYRRMGLDRWHVGLIVLILPTLLHASMLLFFVGLTLNIRLFDVPMAKLVIALTGTFYALYFMSVCLPVFFPQCPYRSPLSEWAYQVKAALDWLRTLLSGEEGRSLPKTWREREEREVATHADYIISRGLDLALQESSDLSIDSLVIQAVSGLPFHSRFVPRANKYYGTLLCGRVLAWFFNTLRNRGFVFDWAPGRERVLQRIACALLLVPEDRLRSSSADNLQYTRCATRILQALMHAISSVDVADSDVLILTAIAIALESRLVEIGHGFALQLSGNEVLEARIASVDATLASRGELRLRDFRLQPVVWEGMLRSLAYRYPRAYVPEGLARLLLDSLHYRDALSSVNDDQQGSPTVSTVTLQQWLDSTPERNYTTLAQDVFHSLRRCPSPSCDFVPVHDRCRGAAELDAADADISLHTVCRVVEVHRITTGIATGDSEFLSTQAVKSLLACLDHGSLRDTWRIVEGSGVSLLFFSKLVSRCRPSTVESVKPRDASSSSLAWSLFWFLVKLLSALDDENYDPFGSSGPTSARSSASSFVPSLPASSAASSSSAHPRARDQAKLDIVRAMERYAAAYFPTGDAAGLPDDLDPFVHLRPIVMTTLNDPHLALSGATPRIIASTLIPHLRRLAVSLGQSEQTRRMDMSWCVFLDVLIAARAGCDGPEAANSLHDALIPLRWMYHDVWNRDVLSAFGSPIPPALGIALASPRGYQALALLAESIPCPLQTLRVWLDEEWYRTCVNCPAEPRRSNMVPISRLVSFEHYLERLHHSGVAHGDGKHARNRLRDEGIEVEVDNHAKDDSEQGRNKAVEESDAKRANALIISSGAGCWARLRGILIFLSNKRHRAEHIELEDSSV